MPPTGKLKTFSGQLRSKIEISIRFAEAVYGLCYPAELTLAQFHLLFGHFSIFVVWGDFFLQFTRRFLFPCGRHLRLSRSSGISSSGGVESEVFEQGHFGPHVTDYMTIHSAVQKGC